MGIRKHVDKDNGFFGIGGNSNITTEEEYTMDGGRHLQGGGEKKVDCSKPRMHQSGWGAGESTGGLIGASAVLATSMV